MLPQVAEDKLIDGYSVTVRGQYHCASGKSRILKTYGPVSFFLPPTVEIPNGKKKVKKEIDGHPVFQWIQQFKVEPITTENVALYVIQRRLLPTWLAEHHPDCVRFRTCSVIPGGIKKSRGSAKEAAGLNKPVSDMSMQELLAFCKLKNINVALMGFSDVKDAREAVQYEMDVQVEKTRQAAEAEDPASATAESDENDDPDEDGEDMLD